MKRILVSKFIDLLNEAGETVKGRKFDSNMPMHDIITEAVKDLIDEQELERGSWDIKEKWEPNKRFMPALFSIDLKTSDDKRFKYKRRGTIESLTFKALGEYEPWYTVQDFANKVYSTYLQSQADTNQKGIDKLLDDVARLLEARESHKKMKVEVDRLLPAMPEPELAVDSHHGMYSAQIFAQQFRHAIVNKEELKEDLDILEKGPDEEFYWDSWENVMDNAILRTDDGKEFSVGTLADEADIWLIPEGYVYPE